LFTFAEFVDFFSTSVALFLCRITLLVCVVAASLYHTANVLCFVLVHPDHRHLCATSDVSESFDTSIVFIFIKSFS